MEKTYDSSITLIIRTFHLYRSFVLRARARAVHGRTNDERQSREANAKFSARLWCGSGTSFSLPFAARNHRRHCGHGLGFRDNLLFFVSLSAEKVYMLS